MNHITLIDNDEKLQDAVNILLKCKEIALDFEGEFNLHRYGMHLCLIQIYDGDNFFIIDPFKIDNKDILRKIFENRDIIKILYSCTSDMKLLDYRYQMRLVNIYDLQAAAKVITDEQLSLDDILMRYLNISFIKDKKMQRSNWNIRPLRQKQIEYAANDVAYLIQAREALHNVVIRKGLLGKLNREHRKLEKIRYKKNLKPWKKIKHYRSLDVHQKIFLKHFFKARDKIARLLDFPPYFVMSNELLLHLAKNPIEHDHEFENLKGLSRKAKPYIDYFVDAHQNARLEM